MSEWRELPTLADVAAAQAAGDEIDIWNASVGKWITWSGKSWLESDSYRARSKPKVMKIKILGWIDPNGETLTRREDFQVEKIWGWTRYPKLDDEVEVPL